MTAESTSTTPDERDSNTVQAKEEPLVDTNVLSKDAAPWQRAFVLFISCLALFIDSFNTGGVIVCLNDIGSDLGVHADIVQWVVTAFNLTYGAFLLLAGRVSDIYHPKPIFIAGFFVVGALALGAGFVNNIIGLIVLRAFQGIGAAMTIPTAVSMLTSAYTKPKSRALALTFFAAAGTMGVCVGFVVGGIIVEYSSWRWVLWAIACVSIPSSILSQLLIPVPKYSATSKDKKLDIPGVLSLTSSIILIIFAFSEAPTAGWGTARVLVPLVVSLLLMVGFFWWQTRLSFETALIPPAMWSIPNFVLLIIGSMCNQTYFIGPVVIYSTYFPETYGWSPLSLGLHFLPSGVISGIVCLILPRLFLRLPSKSVLVVAQAVTGCLAILFAFADTREKYWSHIFPAFILVTGGSSVIYLVSNVVVITSVPEDKVGVGSAVFIGAQQIGSAITVAILTTIFVGTTPENPASDQEKYHGVRSAMWWIVAVACSMSIAFLLFLKPRGDSFGGAQRHEEDLKEKESPAAIV